MDKLLKRDQDSVDKICGSLRCPRAPIDESYCEHYSLISYPDLLTLRASGYEITLLFCGTLYILSTGTLPFESVDEIPKCNRSNESYRAVLFYMVPIFMF